MQITLPYGDRSIVFDVPEKNFIGMLDPAYVPPIADLKAGITYALDHPIGTGTLEEIIKPGKSIAIIVDDGSRPTPIATILPILINRILSIGARKEDIRIVAAIGSHRYMTEDELRIRVGPDIYNDYPVYNSEFKKPEGLVYVGDTPEGVHIYASKVVMETDIHIGVGSLVPHPVMGWGGGGKILFPGITSEKAVAYFHLMASLIDENIFGKDTTPIRDMMERWVDSIGLDFILNVVLNSKMQIADIVSGHYIKAHREGVRRGKKIVGSRVTEKADIMITASHPADQDFWQSPKALYAAEAGVKGSRGNTMILVSPNYEGIGPHSEYPDCMGRENGDAIVEALIRGEDIEGDPLAIAIGNSMSKFRRRRRFIVVSDGVTKDEMSRCGCEHRPVSEIQALIDDLIDKNPDCRIAALSNGAETFLYE